MRDVCPLLWVGAKVCMNHGKLMQLEHQNRCKSGVTTMCPLGTFKCVTIFLSLKVEKKKNSLFKNREQNQAKPSHGICSWYKGF